MRKIFSWFVICIFVGLLALAFIPEPISAMTGSGTAEDPYMVYNVTDLQNMQNHLNAYYELANDIDASATETWNWDAGRAVYEGFVPVGTFTGHFDGNFYEITGLYINRDYSDTAHVGLFTLVGGPGTVDNVFILDADITVTQSSSYSNHVGVLVGDLQNDITQVVVSGSIYVEWTSGHSVVNGVGGLVGTMHFPSASIRKCASCTDVEYVNTTGDSVTVGGLVGHHDGGSIQDCYARGNVTAYSTATYPNAGGCVGRQYNASTYRSYSTGFVYVNVGFPSSRAGGFMGSKKFPGGACTACFWDVQTSSRTNSACGSGRNTAQMKTESTFTDAGWDFDNIWGMGGCVNDGYPYFDWWYDPPTVIDDIYQVVWFQPNTIIQGTTLPNRAEEEDGIITWGANPAGISISHSLLEPEEDYEFEPIIPETADIIRPEPGGMTGDVDLERLENNPFNPLVQAIVSVGGFTARLVWLGIAWFILIAVMIAIQLKTHHMMLTGIAGFGLASLFYVMGIFPLWVVIVFGMGMVASIIYERMTVL